MIFLACGRPTTARAVDAAVAGWGRTVACAADADTAVGAFDDGGCVATVLDVGGAAPAHVEAVARDLQRHWPGLPLVAYVPSGAPPELLRLLLALGRAGVREVVTDPVAEPLRAVVGRYPGAIGARRVLRDLAPALAGPVARIVTCCLDTPANATAVRRVSEAARALGVSRRSLTDWAQSAGAPTPARLVHFGRLLAAAQLFGTPGRRPADVADRLGFGSVDGLRTAARRAGLTLDDLRQPEGFAAVAERLAADVAGARTRPR